jgi:DNA repair exonuclease SbcCD ATPase subunit
VEWQKKYSELENKYKKLEEDTRVLQHDKDEKEHRYVKRETGYRKLVDELHEELRRDFSLNGADRKKMEEIAGLHGKILDNINNIQLKTSKVLLDQEKDIIRFFNNKINEIKKQFEEERIRRGKKDQSYEVKEKQLIAELEWIKDIAQKIDQENHTLMKKHMELKAQYATQENDREILLREVILKKKKNAILKSQIDQYEKMLEDVSKGKEGENSSLLQEFPGESVDRNPAMNASQGGDRRSQLFSAGQERIQTAASTQMRTQNIITKLKSSLQREKRKVQQLKTLYIKELESKSTLEKVLRGCIEDIKDDIFTMQKDKTTTKKFGAQNELLDKKDRNGLVEKLINDERILTLIYDKTFYASNKKIEIPPELLRDDEDDDNLDALEE